MNENTTSQTPMNNKKVSKKKMFGSLAIVVVVIVAIVLGITLGGNGEKKAKKEAAVEETTTGNQTKPMEAVIDGEFTYRFEGIDWQFETADEEGVGIPITRVNMMFENFTRRDGAPYVSFGNPYKFGIYEGLCSEVEALDFDTEVEAGIPLGFVECVWQEEGTQIALFQEGNIIVAKSRQIQSEDGLFKRVSSIDLTTVVQ